MNGRTSRRIVAPVLAVLASGLMAGAANASSIYEYDWDRTDGLGGTNDNGGRLEGVTTTYNQFTDTLTWTVSLSNQVSRPTDGFTLAISPGPNPKSGGGDLALLYFDATTTSDIKVSAFSYNGQNNASSYATGPGENPDGTSNDSNAAIDLGGDGSWIKNASVSDSGGIRTMSLSASAAYFRDMGTGNADWMGYEFGTMGSDPKIGFWFHSFSGLATSYDAEGNLTSWTRSHEGYFDTAGRGVQIVPVPPAVWVGALGLIGAAGLRRRMAS